MAPAHSTTPAHVAIIMDGNGRWAQKRGRPRVFGHIRGASRIRDVVKRANEKGVKALTFFAFSTENWSRPETELSVLWKLLKKYLLKEMNELHRENVRLRVMGEVSRLSSDVKEIVHLATEKMKFNNGLNLTFAVSYGSRREIVDAAKKMTEDVLKGKLSLASVNEELFNQYLWTSELKDYSNVDLLIRTSGEKRISNFLLWQSAYSEFVFTDVLWPDFLPSHLDEALQSFFSRNRRFGGITHETHAP